MIKRAVLLLLSKVKSLFLNSISITSRVEYSEVSRKAKVWGHCKVFHSEIGDYSYLGWRSRLIYAKVGKFCSISSDCAIGMGGHALNNISTASIFTARKNGTGIRWVDNNVFEEYNKGIIEIGNDVWIGQKAMVMSGVRIGNGAVVGAAAVVTKDIPPYAIVGGVPAKIIRYRFSEDVIKKLEASRWWTLNDDVLKSNIELFQRPLNDVNLEGIIKMCNKKGK